ncbi:30S ribosome-binding factor RbfA [Candidatus Saganbacteria bacterium]|nr:30S ribosome-binding factor RbfA [Candidatus Saganbacteria bacterium]
MSRPERVAELIKREVAEIIRDKVSDPRIGFMSVIDVELTPDLKNAKIYISVLGDELVCKRTMEGLKSAKAFIRGELGQLLEMRYIPEIMFIYDKSIARASNVINIMNRLSQK